MIIKFFKNQEHYAIVKEWWEKIHSESQPSDHLPPSGVIVFDDDNNALAAGWIINTDYRKAIFWDFVANPFVRKGRNEAIDLLIMALEEYAIRNGYDGMLGSSKIKTLLERAKKHGYRVSNAGLNIIDKEFS